jgi:hypothetical protein
MYALGDVVDVIPAYGYASPCRRVKVRLAIREHHEACTNEKKHKRQEPRNLGGVVGDSGTVGRRVRKETPRTLR